MVEIIKARESNQKTKVEYNLWVAKQKLMDNCISDAATSYTNNWDGECISLGFEAKCRLTAAMADRWNGQLEFDRQACQTRFK